MVQSFSTRLVLALLVLASSPTAAVTAGNSYDGVVRSDADGRYDAILPPPFASNHASMVEVNGKGSYNMAWFSGTFEGQSDVAIVVSELTLNATGGFQDAVWSNAFVVSERDGYSNQNPVLFHDDDTGVTHLFHTQQLANQGEQYAHVWYLNCSDTSPSGPGPYGFTEPVEIFGKDGSFIKNRLLKALSGDWLLPMYYAPAPDPNYSHIKVLAKGDNPTDPVWGNIDFMDTDNLVQPSVVRLLPGEPQLVAFFRDRESISVYRAVSQDDGATWGEPEAIAGMANPNSGIEASTLASSRVAMVYNPCTSCRDPLVISLSEDGGKTWPYTRVLESDNGSQEFSYPTLRQDDGSIHVSYTYKREAIKHSIVSEDWVMDPQNQYNATTAAATATTA